MPRIKEQTRRGGKPIACDTCHKPIQTGEKYYSWKFRYGGKHGQHSACGHPKPSQLTQSKMQGIYSAVESTEVAIAAAVSTDDLATALRDCASEVETVKDEYQEGFDNMPEGLQSSSTGDERQQKIDNLQEFQDELESTADELESEEFDGEDSDQEARDTWFNDLRQRASDALSNLNE